MSDAAFIAEERARRRAASQLFSVGRATCVSVDPEAMSAVVDPGDGRQIVVYPADGTLPSTGQVVNLFSNGADRFIMGGELLVDGGRQSGNYEPSTSGWGWGADGTLEANEAVIRGDVIGSRFLTSTATDVARVVIDSPTEARRVQFFTGSVDELAPGYIASYDDPDQGTVEVASPEFAAGGAGKRAYVRVGIDRDDGSTYADVVADNIRSNGVSLSRPPYSSKRRVAAQGPIASSPSANAVVVWDTDLHVNFESDITYDGAGTFTFHRNGIWPVQLYIAWADGGGNGDGNRRYYVTENGADRIIGNLPAAGNTGNNTVHNVAADILVPTDSPYTLQIKCGQQNGFAQGLTFTGRITIKRFSAY